MTLKCTSFEFLCSLESHVIIGIVHIGVNLGSLSSSILGSLDLLSGGDLGWVEGHQIGEDS